MTFETGGLNITRSPFQLSSTRPSAVDTENFLSFVDELKHSEGQGKLEIGGTPPRTYLVSWIGGDHSRFSVQRHSEHMSALSRFIGALVDVFSRQSSRIEQNLNRIEVLTVEAVLQGIASHRVKGPHNEVISALRERRERLAAVDADDSESINRYVDSIEAENKGEFRGKDLRHMDFSYLILDDFDFSESDLRGASFRKADLKKANLSRADLRGADFLGAELRRANLDGANLKGVTIEAYQLY